MPSTSFRRRINPKPPQNSFAQSVSPYVLGGPVCQTDIPFAKAPLPKAFRVVFASLGVLGQTLPSRTANDFVPLGLSRPLEGSKRFLRELSGELRRRVDVLCRARRSILAYPAYALAQLLPTTDRVLALEVGLVVTHSCQSYSEPRIGYWPLFRRGQLLSVWGARSACSWWQATLCFGKALTSLGGGSESCQFRSGANFPISLGESPIVRSWPAGDASGHRPALPVATQTH